MPENNEEKQERDFHYIDAEQSYDAYFADPELIKRKSKKSKSKSFFKLLKSLFK
jgi:hypothetical protein